ncbi:hypothetical protein [Vibrio jasicida]|uniref:DUF4156 domain-containing protein n=1 Tax=Vibrio jasicida TaxID=766224 RepID=A0ABW7J7J7_9VIBR|nr:hypothetical protein [Vibrio jasicida]
MEKALILLVMLSSTVHAYSFEQRGFIESCIGIGTLIPSQSEKAEVIKSVYVREQTEEGSKIEDIMMSSGTAKGIVLGVSISSNRTMVSHAIDGWEANRCDSLYEQMKPRYKSK